MRSSWWVAGLAAGLLAVAGCGDSEDDNGLGTDSPEETCAAVQEAITDFGGRLQTAMAEWDGTPENAGEITATAEEAGRELRDLASGSSDGELRTQLETLASRVEQFGARWAQPGAEPDLAEVTGALQPLENRCGFRSGVAGP